ncbi:hypothetical protein ACFL5G_00235 [Candidatus Margulisiibacteriota bacterium]
MAEQNEQSYFSWSMWILFYVHLVLCILTCLILMIFNLLLIKTWRDIWFIWIWLIWGLVVWGHYLLLVFFHSEKWAKLQKRVIQKTKEKIG